MSVMLIVDVSQAKVLTELGGVIRYLAVANFMVEYG
jgi:hypothetical protein